MSKGVNGVVRNDDKNKMVVGEFSISKTMTIFQCKLRAKYVYIGKMKNNTSFVEIRPDRIVLNSLHPINSTVRYHITLPFCELSAIRYCFCSDVSAIFLQPILSSHKKFCDWIKMNGHTNIEVIPTLRRSVPENFIIINLESEISDTHIKQFRKAAIECNTRLAINVINFNYAKQLLETPNKTNNFSRSSVNSFGNSSNHINNNNFKRKIDDKEEIINIDDDNHDQDEKINNNDDDNILNQAILKYPENEEENLKSIILYGNDLKCLREGQYLNDNIMNFYLKYYQLNGPVSSEILEKIHIFDALFATHLLKINTRKRSAKTPYNSRLVSSTSYDSLENSYHKVLKKWTKDINIFTKDFLFFPLVINCHWFLIILCYIRNVIDDTDANCDEMTSNLGDKSNGDISSRKKPLLIVMDSLGPANCNQIIACIINYLQLELKEKYSLDKTFNFKDIKAKVPRQQNTYDCGLFVLEYIEKFLKEPDVICDKLVKSSSSLEHWFDFNTLNHKRAKIQQIILNMLSPNDAKNLEKKLTQIHLDQQNSNDDDDFMNS